MKYKILFTLGAFLIGTIPSFAFEDVESAAVERLLEKNVFEDTEYFFPEYPCTREVFVTWALKNIHEDVTGQKITEPFRDVKRENKYTPFIGKAWQIGAIETSSTFEPKKAITDMEAIMIALKIEGIPVPRAGFEFDREYDDLPENNEEKAYLYKALEMRIAKPKNKNHLGIGVEINRLACAQLLDALSLTRSAEQLIFNVESANIHQKPKQEIFDNVYDILGEQYLYSEDVSRDALMTSAIKSMVDSLEDPYTDYFNKQETSNFLTGVGESNEFGIGSQVGVNEAGQTIILKPLRSSPSEKAGLQPGDIVVEVDGEDVSSGKMPIEQVTQKIKGEEGTPVNIKFQRGETFFEVEIIRASLVAESVFVRKHKKFLVIQIDYFGDDTDEKFRKALQENKQYAKNGIIIDLRNNPGGFMVSAANILSNILENGDVAFKIRAQDYKHTEFLNGPGDFSEYPLVVLVNEYSASASEIIAGAVQDNNRGAILGKQTFGKGTAQDFFEFHDGSALKVTIMEWLTPNGDSIEKIGVTPHYKFEEIENTEKALDFAASVLKRGQWKVLN